MKKNVRGFSLVELIIVVAVISLLSVSAMVFYRTNSEQADNSVRQNDIQTVEAALGSQTKIQGFSYAKTTEVFELTADERSKVQDKNLMPPSSAVTLYPIKAELAAYLSLSEDELKLYAVDEFNRVYFLNTSKTPVTNNVTLPEIDDDMDVVEPPKITPRPTPEPPEETPEPTDTPEPGDANDDRFRPDVPERITIPVESFDWQKYVEARMNGTRNGNTVTPGGTGRAAATTSTDDYFYDIFTSSGNARGVCFVDKGVYYIIRQSNGIILSNYLTGTGLKEVMEKHKNADGTYNYDLSLYYGDFNMARVDLNTSRILPNASADDNSRDKEEYNPKTTTYTVNKGDVAYYEGNYYVWDGADNKKLEKGLTDAIPKPTHNSWLIINTTQTPPIY